MAFEVGEACVVPLLGVGRVQSIDEMSVEDQTSRFYVIKIENATPIYLCPVERAEANGLRRLITPAGAKAVFALLQDQSRPPDTQTWNRRFREYDARLLSGDPMKIAEVTRDLLLHRTKKELSFGEKRMLGRAHKLLLPELAMVLGSTVEKIEADIEDLFDPPASLARPA